MPMTASQSTPNMFVMMISGITLGGGQVPLAPHLPPYFLPFLFHRSHCSAPSYEIWNLNLTVDPVNF